MIKSFACLIIILLLIGCSASSPWTVLDANNGSLVEYDSSIESTTFGTSPVIFDTLIEVPDDIDLTEETARAIAADFISNNRFNREVIKLRIWGKNPAATSPIVFDVLYVTSPEGAEAVGKPHMNEFPYAEITRR